jgi:hypothetical protein
MLNHLWVGNDESSFRKSMYVYIELDNLEYLIEKYHLGFLRNTTALRGLLTFKTRCCSAEFRNLALKLAHTGGYNADTKEARENNLTNTLS